MARNNTVTIGIMGEREVKGIKSFHAIQNAVINLDIIVGLDSTEQAFQDFKRSLLETVDGFDTPLQMELKDRTIIQSVQQLQKTAKTSKKIVMFATASDEIKRERRVNKRKRLSDASTGSNRTSSTNGSVYSSFYGSTNGSTNGDCSGDHIAEGRALRDGFKTAAMPGKSVCTKHTKSSHTRTEEGAVETAQSVAIKLESRALHPKPATTTFEEGLAKKKRGKTAKAVKDTAACKTAVVAEAQAEDAKLAENATAARRSKRMKLG